MSHLLRPTFFLKFAPNLGIFIIAGYSMNHIFLTSCMLVSSVLPAVSQSATEEARSLIERGKLEDARALTGNSNAREDLLLRGRLAFLDYNFDEADRLYGLYRKALKKESPGSEYDFYSNQLDIARNALESVEEIQVIDEFSVDADSFFRSIRIPISAGRLLDPSEIPFDNQASPSTVAFTNERGDFIMWGETDENGLTSIMESNRLTDGTWEAPLAVPEFLNNGGDSDFPFMMADGTTLYYASDGEDSMGGFDIFVASKDPSTGEYRQPQNIGMPYNSPFDDYMLCIDELNGIGWWASDRNLLENQLTVYVYLLNDVRKNLDPENETIAEIARLSDISMTIKEGTDVAEYKKLIRSIEPGKPEKAAEFHFPIAAGKTLTAMDEFKTREGAQYMTKYLSDSEKLAQDKQELDRLRRKYHAATSSARNAMKGSILTLEQRVEAQERELRLLRGKIVAAEKRK